MQSKLKTSLLKHCKTQEEELELRQSFVAGLPFRRILEKQLKEKMNAVHTNQVTDREYDGQWAYKQAADNGYQRAIKEILTFLE